MTQYIYWSDVGSDGADFFKREMERKKMADAIAASSDLGLTPEKAAKMIRKAEEHQEKMFASRSTPPRRKTSPPFKKNWNKRSFRRDNSWSDPSTFRQSQPNNRPNFQRRNQRARNNSRKNNQPNRRNQRRRP